MQIRVQYLQLPRLNFSSFASAFQNSKQCKNDCNKWVFVRLIKLDCKSLRLKENNSNWRRLNRASQSLCLRLLIIESLSMKTESLASEQVLLINMQCARLHNFHKLSNWIRKIAVNLTVVETCSTELLDLLHENRLFDSAWVARLRIFLKSSLRFFFIKKSNVFSNVFSVILLCSSSQSNSSHNRRRSTQRRRFNSSRSSRFGHQLHLNARPLRLSNSI